MQGDWSRFAYPVQRSYWCLGRICSLINCTYLHPVSKMGRGSTQEPPCRQFAIFIFSALLSQSVHSTIYSRLTELHQNTLILRARTSKAYFALTFTLGHPISPVRFNWGVFCTYDAFHINNSISYFWASVSFIPVSSRWYEPFGESLSRLTIDSKTMSEFTLLN